MAKLLQIIGAGLCTLLSTGAASAWTQASPMPAPLPSRSEGEWLSGDLHVHSRHSEDSSYNNIGKIIAFAEQAGMGFLAITDHDNHANGDVANHTWADPEHAANGLILLYGAEFTTHRGHANTFASAPYDHQSLWNERNAPDREIGPLIEALGIHFSANHPENNDPFSFSYDFVDSIEVWNSVQFTDGTTVWDDLLKSGRRITGRGGSDAHHGAPGPGERSGDRSIERWFNYVGTPTTWVYATESSAAGVLDGLAAGRVSVSANPYGPRVELTADLDVDGAADLSMGETACASGRPVRFTVRLTGGRADHGRRYEVTVIRNGAEWQTLRTDANGVAVFDDTPPTTGPIYYRVVINGRKDGYPGVGLSRFIGGDLVALSNPVYFNYE